MAARARHSRATAAALRSEALPAETVYPAPARSLGAWDDDDARARRRAGARRRARAKLPARLLIFIICLAVLAVGRVTLSFAVVQKNIATSAIMAQDRALTAENADLAERIARGSSTLRVRTIAVDRLGLVPTTNVIYLSLRPRADRSAGDHTR